MGHYLLFAFIVGVLLLAIVPVVVRLRRTRKYTYFRVIDEKSGQPLANAEVFVFEGATPQTWVSNSGRVMTGAPVEPTQKRIGTLDADGTFRRQMSALASALSVKAPGLTAGIIGLESVSEYGSFPAEPYVCVVRAGMIAPPRKPSPLVHGLGPGETLDEREGYINLYEAPENGDDYIAWPTLEEARANNQSGSMARYWKVRGLVTGPGVGGSSVLLNVKTFSRVGNGGRSKATH